MKPPIVPALLVLAGISVRRDQQKCRDAFIGVTAAEQEYALIRAVERALECAVLTERIGIAVQRRTARQDCVGDRLGGRIARTIFHAEHIALIEKPGQLAVPVSVEMTGSDGAGDDFEPAIPRDRPAKK